MSQNCEKSAPDASEKGCSSSNTCGCYPPQLISWYMSLYHTAYRLNPNLRGQKAPNQIWKETLHCKYKQTITFLCGFIWRCKWKSGFARAIQLTVMLPWMTILESVKVIKKHLLAESWHFILDPLVTGANLMGGSGTTQIVCGSQDQPILFF